MKPIAIFRHSPGEGAGYFATFLDRNDLPWTLFRIDNGAIPPSTSSEFSGLCFMGGPMSVNDDLPWISSALALIRDADERGIPIIGHCLGGQLISKAMGGTVIKNPVKEIGWGQVEASDPTAAAWIGEVSQFEVFHWHGETFSIPPGATRILRSSYCENQAFVRNRTLAMQCHVEMTETMIRDWCRHWVKENASASASVQTPTQMQAAMAERIATMRIFANRLYGRWATGLKNDD